MSIESTSVSTFMTKNVKTETEDQNIQSACRNMHQNNIGSIVIVKGDNHDGHYKPTGIITERDVVRMVGSLDQSLLKLPLGDLMSKPLVTITPKNSLKDALQIMQQKNIRRLVIVENERAIGIITTKDLFNVILNNQNLIPSLLQDKVLVGQKGPMHDQFGQYWFSDIFPMR
jgi:CBS domain-containing protein